ncbi:MAG TPA: hypothetical protein VKY65_14270 [Alphaproteobacteria bacterium]|nr:hypothetical protein [Alphaproteobacteria bacterium]
MAKNLRKFANLQFLNTVDLALMRRLLERHAAALQGFDMAVFEGSPRKAREALRAYFQGPDGDRPESLIADLFRIAELGNARGLELLLEAAHRHGVTIQPTRNRDDEKSEPKQVALRCFLDHPQVFNEASDLLSVATMSAPVELRGADVEVQAHTDRRALAAFEREAKRLFEADLRGSYCRVGCYHDNERLVLIVTHGAPLKTTEVIEDGMDRVVSFREIARAVLSYDAASGRLEIGRIAKARCDEFADIFARCLIGKPGFFKRPDARRLYTLAPVERAGFGFRVTHAFDPAVRKVTIFEAEVQQVGLDRRTGRTRVYQRLILRDPSGDALASLGHHVPGIRFGPDWQLSRLGIEVEIDSGTTKPDRVRVMLKPPAVAKFKRHRHEHRIFEILHHNGLVYGRDARPTAVAAE